MAFRTSREKEGSDVFPTIALPRHNVPHPATRIFHVPFSSLNEMNVAMKDCLPGGLANVDTHVEPNNGAVFLLDGVLGFLQKVIPCLHFRGTKVEEISDMTLWNDEGMQGRNGIFIVDDHGEVVIHYDSFQWQIAERTASFSPVIRFSDWPEIGVVPVALHGIALVTKCLKFGWIVRATFISGYDMVRFQGTLIGGYAA